MISVEVTGPLSALRGIVALTGVREVSRGVRRLHPDTEEDLWIAWATLDSNAPVAEIEARGTTVQVIETEAQLEARLQEELRSRDDGTGPVG